MKKAIPIILLCYFSVQSLPTFCQSTTPNVPRVIPPPAEAASLGKYGAIPVNLSTGTANIEVPVYEIKTPRLSLPIKLNYMSTGIRVDERASWTGLGWSLDAGGIITRTLKHFDDLLSTQNRGYYYHPTPPDADTISQFYSWRYLDSVSIGQVDTEPDHFFFNYSKYAGKFVFGENKKPMIINYQDPMKINFDPVSETFSILDGEGNQYIFATKDTARNYYTMLSNYPFPNRDQSYVSSWSLTKIISFDKTDTISFTYYRDVELLEMYPSYSEVVGQKYVCSGSPSSPQLTSSGHEGANEISSISYIHSNPRRLSEITFRNGKITFHSSANRSDAQVAKLDSIAVYRFDQHSQGYQLLEKTKFLYSYFTTSGTNQDAYKLRLDSILTEGSAQKKGPRHSFVYNSMTLPHIGSTARDLFGYYNGKTSNTTLIARDTVMYGLTLHYVGGANRSTDTNYLRTGTLQRITYPTGGFTNFEYEPNSYSGYGTKYLSQSASATGVIDQTDTVIFTATSGAQAILHVHISRYDYPGVQTPPFVSLVNLTTSQTIYLNGLSGASTDFDLYNSVSLVQGHTYRLVAKAYDNDHVFSGIGVRWKEIDSSVVSQFGGGLRMKQTTSFERDGKFSHAERYKYGTAECGYGFLPAPNFLLNTLSAERAYYLGCSAGVGCSGATITRKVYNSAPLYDIFTLSASPVSYGEVSKYAVDSLGNNIGRTVYNYSVYSNQILPASQAYFEGLSIVNSGWAGGKLLSQTDYANKAGNYFPVKKIVNYYDSIPLQVGRGFKANYTASISGCYVVGQTGMTYYALDYPIYSGTSLPSRELEYVYDQKDTTKVSTTTKYFSYNNYSHLQPWRIKTTTSTGDTLLNINRYPIDKDSLSNLTSAQRAALDTLVARHNLIELVQTQTIRNSEPITLTRNDFKLWPAGFIKTDSVRVQQGAFPIERRMQFHKYDVQGNIVQVSKSDDYFQTYIWDYKVSMPIAEAKNADSISIAFTSFEADGKGNWSYAGLPFRDNTAPTGRKVYKLTNGSITKSGLNASASYIVSYWSKNGAQSVNSSTAGIAGFTLGNWQYWVHKVVNPPSGTIAVSGTGTIDELRLYPEQSEMTSYTYEPLIGMTTQSDPQGRISYYEYDELQRLMLVRNQDKKIVKKICYNYAGQPENCQIYYNVEKRDTLTRTCTSPAVGSEVIYVVPEGSYSSTSSQSIADNLAQADVNQNGQAYAEANGSCFLSFSGINLTSVTWSITVTQVDGTFTGNYSLNPTITANFLATIPTGIYNITMTPSTSVNSVQLLLNSSTYNGTSFNLSNISIGTTATFTLQGPPCTYSMQSGFTKVAGEITNNGTGVSFYLSFSKNSQMVQNTGYIVAIISTNCRPPQWVVHTFQWTQSFRNWTLHIFDNGQFALSFTGGLPVPTNATITTPSFNYNF